MSWFALTTGSVSGATNAITFSTDLLGDVMELGQICYRAIGVEMQGDAEGNVTVNGCYFSQFYSGPVCDVISALDDGIFSGLLGGGRLAFSERITEGRPYCRAELQRERTL